MRNKTLWAFDYDGVLVNSTKYGIAAMIQTAYDLQLTAPPLELIKKYWGKHLEEEFVPSLGEALEWDHLQQKRFLNCYLDLSAGQIYPLPPALIEFLLKLKEGGADLVIVTNRDLNSLFFRSHQSGLDLSLFHDLICPTNGVAKPNPRIFQSLWRNGFSPADSVFVGDAIYYDLEAASNHSPPLDFIAITGLHSKEEFLQAGVPAEFIYDQVSDIEL